MEDAASRQRPNEPTWVYDEVVSERVAAPEAPWRVFKDVGDSREPSVRMRAEGPAGYPEVVEEGDGRANIAQRLEVDAPDGERTSFAARSRGDDG